MTHRNPKALILNIAQILREGGSTQLSGEIEGPLELDQESIPLSGPAQWKVSVVSVSGEGHQDFWLSGEIAGNALLDCRRCLEPSPTPVRSHFQHMLRYQPGHQGLEAIEEGEEEIIVFGHPDLDLYPFLSEAFALEIPYTTICKEDCKGLCPVCGTNRNHTDCGHTEEKPTKLGAELDKLLDGMDD